MSKILALSVLLAVASLQADSPGSIEQFENKEAVLVPKVEYTEPVALEETKQTEPLSIEVPSAEPVVNQEEVQAQVLEVEPLEAQLPVQEAAISADSEEPTSETVSIEPAPTKMEEPKNIEEPCKKKQPKTRFANIAIATASAAVVIVSAILGSN